MKKIESNNDLDRVAGIEKSEFPQAKDVLDHFNTNIYPDIEKKYHPKKDTFQEKTNNQLTTLFGIIKKENIEKHERSYKELGIQTAQGITDFILGDNPQDPSRIQLLLQAMRLDMINIAYGNTYLMYSSAADRYGEHGDEIKKHIIKECLKICSEKFKSSAVTLTITDNHVIVNHIRSGQQTIHNKKDFKSDR